VKVRKDQKPRDYRDPGWYRHPPGTLAYEFNGTLPEPSRSSGHGSGAMAPVAQPDVEVTVRKPGRHGAGHR